MIDATFVQLLQEPNNALSWWQLRETEKHYDAALKRRYGAFWQRAKFESHEQLDPTCASWQRAYRQAVYEWNEICKGAV